jgi:hypothetical protein
MERAAELLEDWAEYDIITKTAGISTHKRSPKAILRFSDTTDVHRGVLKEDIGNGAADASNPSVELRWQTRFLVGGSCVTCREVSGLGEDAHSREK